MNFEEWEKRHPVAAAELYQCFAPEFGSAPMPPGTSEAATQQKARITAAQAGAFAWRNNVGVLKDENGTPVRFGLANDSAKLNRNIKSSDLILMIPRTITRHDVGSTIAQFGAVECKAAGWEYKGTPRERAQRAFLTLVRRFGGFATFSTGELKL